MGRLRRWSRRKADFALSWDTVAAADLAEQPGLMAEIMDGRRDGVTVTDVFSPAEIERALDVLGSLDESETLDLPYGWLLGMPIGWVGDSTDRTAFFDDTERAQVIYRKAFGFDPHDRISSVLSPISAGAKLVPPEENGRRYNPGQIRWWEPGGGGLVAHVGNEFRAQMEDGAMNHLVTSTRVTNHLSYFVVLQRAHQGGELSVFDLTYADNPGREDWGSEMPDDAWIDPVPAVRFDLQPGEMVLFGGGWRWHRVDPPHGEVPRVTYGGFLAPAAEGNEIHFWC